MKTITFGLILMMSFALSASAVERWELDGRIQSLTANFVDLEHQPDKAVPADLLRRARGIVLLNRTKAGFVFAYQGGSGVAMVRSTKTDKWGPVAFVTANQASLGFQVGAEQNFFVILLMDTNATRFLTEPTFDFGAEARGTAGNTTAQAGATVNTPGWPILVYGERKGLYGGAALKAGAITADQDANRAYYNRYDVTMRDILFDKHFEPSHAAHTLAETINSYSNPPPQTGGP